MEQRLAGITDRGRAHLLVADARAAAEAIGDRRLAVAVGVHDRGIGAVVRRKAAVSLNDAEHHRLVGGRQAAAQQAHHQRCADLGLDIRGLPLARNHCDAAILRRRAGR